MNIEFVTSDVFFAYFIMSMALAFALMTLWVVYDLDRDDEKTKFKKTKLKKA